MQLLEVSRKIGLGNRPSRLFLSRSDGAGLLRIGRTVVAEGKDGCFKSFEYSKRGAES